MLFFVAKPRSNVLFLKELMPKNCGIIVVEPGRGWR